MINTRFSLILLLSLLLGGAILSRTDSFRIPEAAAIGRTITLVGFFQGWNATSVSNPTITVNQGDVITLQLSSGDGITHQWFVDVDKNGPAADCPGADICSSAFSASTTLTFTVSFAPSTYTYYCILHPTTMLGQFIVNPSTAVGGTALPANKPALVSPCLVLFSALIVVVAVSAYVMHSRGTKTRENEGRIKSSYENGYEAISVNRMAFDIGP